MKLVVVAALIAVCGAAKLDRGYLPPVSAKTAGGSPGALQTPFQTGSTYSSQGNQGIEGLPKGSHTNEFQGVVVDAASAGTRAAEPGDTGLGGPRASYGFDASRVGDAAFRGAPSAGFRQFPQSEESLGIEAQASAQFSSPSNVGSITPTGFNRPSFNAQPVEAERPERPQAEQDRNAGVLRFESDVGAEQFSYSFETDNGITAEESGVAKDGVQAQGAFSYTGDDGQTYSVTYTADENGYQPVGDHLPTPPPIPEAILKSLEQNARDEAAGLSDDGSYDATKYNVGSDYNESDNGNSRYNGKQSNIGSRNGDGASASGTFVSQNSAPFSQHGAGNSDESMRLEQSVGLAQQPLEDRKPTGFGAPANNLNGFSQKYSAQATATVSNNGFEQDNNNFGQRGSGNNNGIGSSGELNNAFSQHTISQSNFGPENEKNSESGSDSGFSQSTPSHTRFTTQSSGNSEHGAAQGNKAFGRTTPSHNTFGNMFTQSTASNGNTHDTQELPNNGNEQSAESTVTQSSTSNSAFGQNFGNNNFGAQQQSQTGLNAQKFGYLPPTNNPSTPGRRPSFSQQESTAARPSITPAFIAQQSSQSSRQQFSNNGNYQNQPLQKSDAPSSSSFASTQYDAAAQSSANVEGQFPQQFSNAQNRYQPSSQSSFSRQPNHVAIPTNQQSNTPLNRFSQQASSSNARPTPQGFRQQPQNIPQHVANEESQSQTSASAFASFNSQPESGSQTNFNNEAKPQYSASTEQPQYQESQFSQFNNQAKQNQFSQKKPNSNQFVSSTKMPFSQNTLPQQQSSSKNQDDSYYYNQPSQNFKTPEQPQNTFQRQPSNGQSQSSFSSQASAQFSAPSQQAFPTTLQPGATRYPRPPSLAPAASTSASHTETDSPQPTFQSQFNGVTQASASSFASPTPSSQYNGQFQRFSQAPSRPNNQNSFGAQVNGQPELTFPQRSQPSGFPQPTTASPQAFPQKPSPQAFPQKPSPQAFPQKPSSHFDQNSNQHFQGSQSFGQRPSSQFQSQTATTEEPTSESTPSQQYSGEIYEYSKPAETLPPPDATPQSSEEKPVQFGAKVEKENAESPQESQKPQTSFGSRPKQNNQFSQSRKPDQGKPQFGSQQQMQFAGQTSQNNAQAQASAGFQSPEQKQFGAFSQQNQFSGAQFSGHPGSQTFKLDDQFSSQTAGKGEVFGGPRAPPSFDEETGYHY